MNPMLPDIARVLITEEDLQRRVQELAGQISKDYENLNPLLVCVLKWGYVFLADLTRAISIRHGVDFMAVSSYGNSTTASGVVRIPKDLDRDICSRHVLLVEDIIYTGHTIAYLLENLRTRQPASLRVCTLLSKPSRREIDLPVDYVGFEIPNEFVIGYGLDYSENYRNLSFIGVLRPEVYS